ncbi:MAG: hypothetical protein HY007_02690 [Candidatus Sungbacteria bacterium]|nr:hypothetical protein [Candidatus Sungbacteria bacterium]
MPFSAHAILGVGDVGVTVTLPGSVTSTETLTNPQTFGSTTWLLRYIVNPLARAATRAVLTSLTQQVVNWVSANGGNNVGFVGNFEQTLTNELDNEAGQILDQFKYIDFCGDIGTYLRLNLRGPAGGFRQRARCTLTAAVKNVQSFYDNFQNGGWETFLKTNVDIQNNTAGAFLIGFDYKLAMESRRKEEFGLKYQKSSVLGITIPKKISSTCIPTDSRKTFGNDPNLGKSYSRSGSKLSSDVTTNQTEFGSESCLNTYEEQTPGTIIEQTIKDANKTGIDFGISAKDFDEAIGAIMTALLQRTISSAGGIFGKGSPGQANYGDQLYSYKEIGPSQDALRSRTEAGIFLAYGATQAIDASVLALRAEIAATSTLSAAREKELKEKTSDLLAKKQVLAAAESRIVTTKQSSFNAVTQGDIAAIDGRITQSMNAIEPIAAEVKASPYASPTGDMKTDALNDLSGARTAVASTRRLVGQAIDEIDAALGFFAAASTTRQADIATLHNYRDTLFTSIRATTAAESGATQKLLAEDGKLQNEYNTIQRFVTSSEAIGETGTAISLILAANEVRQNAATAIQNTFSFLDSIVGQALVTPAPQSPSTAATPVTPETPETPPIPAPIESGGEPGE